MRQAMTVENKINPFKLPYVTVSDKKLLPNSRGLYFVLRGDQILYIGKAFSGLVTRWRDHHRLPQLNASDKLAYLEIDLDDLELAKLEKAEITRLQPFLNDTECICPKQKNRFTIDLMGLRDRVEKFSPDPSWRQLSFGGKIRALIETALEVDSSKSLS